MSSVLWSYKPAKEKKEKPVERGKEEDVPSALDSDRSYAYKGKGRKGRKDETSVIQAHKGEYKEGGSERNTGY